MTWVDEVKLRAESGKPPVRGGRTQKNLIDFDRLTFVPVQMTKRPVDYFRAEIKTETIIGKSSKHPLKLKTPIMIAAMSFGALSKEAKIALARASKMVGTTANTGEGGMLPEEREEAELLIVQYSTGRFGINEEVLKSADAIEVKIGQGGKPGQGGLLPADKVTDDIAKIRNVPVGEDVHSPPFHHDINTIEDLKKRIEMLRDTTDGKPIILKLGAGRIEEDVKLALQANPDAIAIDGAAGGTGAAPAIMLDDFGVPTLTALIKARAVMNHLGAKQELIIAGGLNKGADVAKALALGADAVYFGMPMIVAMGCIYCKMCYKGQCPVGIMTQDPELRKKINVEDAARKVANLITACTEEVKMAAGACGKDDIHKLDGSDLRSLDLETAKMTGVPVI